MIRKIFFQITALIILTCTAIIVSCSKTSSNLDSRLTSALKTEAGVLIRDQSLASNSLIVFYRFEQGYNDKFEGINSERNFNIVAETKISCGSTCIARGEEILNVIGPLYPAECKPVSPYHRVIVFYDSDMNITIQFTLDQTTKLIHVEKSCFSVNELNSSLLNSPDFSF